MGENITQASGSGTINPRTGLKEYDWRYTDPLNLHHATDYLEEAWDWITNESEAAQIWNYVMPVGGTDPFSSDPSETTLMEREAGKVMGGAITNLQEQYQQVIGPGGTMKQQRDITEKGLGTKRDVAMQDIMGKRRGITKAGEGITSKSNLVLGEVQSDIERQQGLLTSAGKVVGQEYKTGMETTALSYQKDRSDFVANLKKQMADLLISYQQATGEAYGGDWEETTSQWS